MKLYSVLLFAALCASCAEDDGGQTPGNSFREPVPETITLDEVEEAFHKMERGEVLRSVVVL